MKKPKTIVLTGYGINCEEEVAFAFKKAGADVAIVHINDLIDGIFDLNNYEILTIPGGFSFGDDLGAGMAYSLKLRNHLEEALRAFIKRETLVFGICNGCQILANMGFIPALSGYGKTEAAFRYNSSARYEDRWVSLKAVSKNSPFTSGIDFLRVPIAHGEGNFYADSEIIKELGKSDQIVFQYVKPDGTAAKGEFPFNPNGSLLDIAGISDSSGRVMGMMPHPDRHLFFTNRDFWTLEKERLKRNGEKVPEEGEGMKIFRNAVEWFQ